MDIWGVIIVLFLAWCIIADIIYIGIRFIKLIVCRKVKDCKNRKCLVSGTCRKYNKFLTEEEYYYLLNLINNAFREEKTQ